MGTALLACPRRRLRSRTRCEDPDRRDTLPSARSRPRLAVGRAPSPARARELFHEPAQLGIARLELGEAARIGEGLRRVALLPRERDERAERVAVIGMTREDLSERLGRRLPLARAVESNRVDISIASALGGE